MSNEFAEIIGNYTNITTPAVKKLLGDFISLMVTKVKDDIMDNEGLDSDHPVFKQFITFAQASEPKPKPEKKGEKAEKKEKPTYHGTKVVTDKETGTKTQVEADIPLKNFASLTIGVKTAMMFLLNRYIHECKLCYDSMKSFNGVTDVIAVVDNYVRKELPDGVTPFIRSIVQSINVEDVLPNTYLKFNSTLTEKICTYFKDAKESYPEKQLITIADTFMQFLKILALLFTNQIFEKRKPINEEFFVSNLRMMNVFTYKTKASIGVELMQSMKDYVKVSKPEKDPSAPPKERKKPAAKKSATPKKPSKKEKEEEDEDAMEDFDEEEEEAANWDYPEENDI
jgi:hypothetical protein